MQRNSAPALSFKTVAAVGHARLAGRDGAMALADLAAGSCLDVDPATLAGKSVVIATLSQLTAALAMIELDGVARRLVICPPDLTREHLAGAMIEAGADAIVTDDAADNARGLDVKTTVTVGTRLRKVTPPALALCQTEWVLFTSGTAGAPKMVVHDLAGLAGAIGSTPPSAAPVVWSTFYDIRRYGGMQIFLRAVLGGAKLVLSSAGEPVAEFLARAAAEGVTNISGTPSHWRNVLMRPPVPGFAPPYIRLSGEIADQAVLDRLKGAFPGSRIVHAFASTEAGVGFEVHDGREGFPASLMATGTGDVAFAVVDGTLRIRSRRTASRYLGRGGELVAGDGFVDTGDMVELRGDRYYFTGRRGGIVNVGGLKVHPEEVEAVINLHPAVEMSLVKARRSPVTGAIVTAEIVLKAGDADAADAAAKARIESEIRAQCKSALAVHKVPAIIKFVPALAVTPGGKLARRDA